MRSILHRLKFVRTKLIFVFIFIFLFLKGVILVYPDLNLFFPYMAPDSYDWIANGLHYAGFEVNFSLIRPPGLPLLIAALEKISLLRFLPLLNQIIFFGIIFMVFKILFLYFSEVVSILSSLFMFFSSFFQDLSNFILADTYALFFILLGYYFYLRTNKNEDDCIFTSIFWSLSFLFQYAIASLIPAFVIHFFLFRKRISFKTALKTFIIPIFIIGGWFLFKQNVFWNISQNTSYIKLVHFHTNSIFFYIINIIAVLGLFGAFLILFSIAKNFVKMKSATDNTERNEFFILNFLICISWFLFWVFLYDWNDRRFIAYLAPFLVMLLAFSIDHLVMMFKKFRIAGKCATAMLIILSFIWIAIPYASIFSFDTLKIAPGKALKFEIEIDPKTAKGNIGISKINIIESATEFNSVNLFELFLRKNIEYTEAISLAKIKNEANFDQLGSLCIQPAIPNNFQLYILKNKYGNYFKRIVSIYPDCPIPNFLYSSKGLESI